MFPERRVQFAQAGVTQVFIKPVTNRPCTLAYVTYVKLLAFAYLARYFVNYVVLCCSDLATRSHRYDISSSQQGRAG